jgi:hypothetical protein
MQCDREHGCYKAMVDGFRFVSAYMAMFITVPTVEKINLLLRQHNVSIFSMS